MLPLTRKRDDEILTEPCDVTATKEALAKVLWENSHTIRRIEDLVSDRANPA